MLLVLGVLLGIMAIGTALTADLVTEIFGGPRRWSDYTIPVYFALGSAVMLLSWWQGW
jgi:hypothetical protein